MNSIFKYLDFFVVLCISLIIGAAVYVLALSSEPTKKLYIDDAGAVTLTATNKRACIGPQGSSVACELVAWPKFLRLACRVGDAPGDVLCSQTWMTDFVALLVPFLPIFGWLGSFGFGERARLTAAFSPKAPRKGWRKNTILLIGLGRSGKSELIKAMSASLNEVPPDPTEDWELVRFNTVDNDGRNMFYVINDYRGQSLNQVTENFVKEQITPNSDFRYNDINTIILMVDLFKYSKSEKWNKAYPQVDQKYIDSVIASWNEPALDAIFGLLTKEALTGVFLFINKEDKWKTQLSDSQKRREIEKLYVDLISDLKRRAKASDADFDWTPGAVMASTGIGTLTSFLKKNSVPK